MKTKLFTLAIAVLTIGLLISCKKDNGPETPKLPDGALSGEFTVNAAGKKVHFSKGNLYYDGNAFRFETNQYDGQSSWNTSHVSHFYWSRTASEAYAENYEESGTTASDAFFTNATAETAKADFTVNGVTGKYRTLSKNEWTYLFDSRTVNGGTGKDKSYSLDITYGGKTGIVLYPDNYTGSVLSGTVNTLPEGVVFLPSKGYRVNSSVHLDDQDGYYWSSSAFDGSIAYNVIFSRYNVNLDNYAPRNSGFSVRLITESK